MRLEIYYGSTPDSNTPTGIYVDGVYDTISDSDCSEIAEALRTTTFVQNTLNNPTNSYVVALTQSAISRIVIPFP